MRTIFSRTIHTAEPIVFACPNGRHSFSSCSLTQKFCNRQFLKHTSVPLYSRRFSPAYFTRMVSIVGKSGSTYSLPKLPLFEAISRHNPDSSSVIHCLSKRTFKYGSLLGDVARARLRLLEIAGKQPQDDLNGERVAFLIENGYDYVGMRYSQAILSEKDQKRHKLKYWILSNTTRYFRCPSNRRAPIASVPAGRTSIHYQPVASADSMHVTKVSPQGSRCYECRVKQSSAHVYAREAYRRLA